ncbi:FtsX-like permease family protein [Actinoplanes sp. NPDC051411]|uniref:FtsX-like permease family protein n=1 Tax=Actinoplanes sp. NPDC051411 TaxID=3155522 RepID=UPI0034173C58
MIRLAARLILGGGREALVRLVVTAFGVALGVALLLFSAVAFPALHAHDLRAGWLATGAHNARPVQNESTTDPLLFLRATDHYGKQEMIRVDVAAEGPRAPVPPGLSRIPGPGQYAVSPALARLISDTPADMLAQRFPGRPIETIGDAALAGPQQLMVVVGHDPASMRAFTGVQEVRSIEGAPVRHGYNEFLRIMLTLGIIALILPVVVFISAATRLAAARREQRLAALRLVGVTPGQAAALAAIEAGLAAVCGTVLGIAVFAVVRPSVARIPFDGNTFFPSDLRLYAVPALIILLGVPALSIMAAELSLRRVRISPLGVTRQTPRPRPTWRRLIPLGAGLTGFAIALPVSVGDHGSQSSMVGVSATFLVVIAGIMTLGPWLTILVGTTMLKLRGTTALLAGRRLQNNPAAGFRSISGLVLAVFTASLICGVLPSVMTGQSTKSIPLPPGTVTALLGGRQATGIRPAAAAALLARLRTTPGITHITAIRRAPENWTTAQAQPHETPASALLTCADLNATGVAACPDPSAVVAVDLHLLGVTDKPFRTLTHPVPSARLDSLPLAALSVATDGRTTTLETARTAISAAVGEGQAAVDTTADANAELNHRLIQLQRLVTVALALTLLIAGCSLAVAIAGGLVERKRPFTLLRLAGAQPANLRRVVLAETTAPLLTIALTSAGLGLALAAIVIEANHTTWKPPDPTYWAALGSGILIAVALSAATALPLLSRLTSLQTARFE